ncbi:type II toxin-antitoxin system Phd/YefM family antitoxin [Coraliomargarita parva]|uniref:type II toxin-antitoxin system Phd/YefM family antitoxin n=1 Tax=Coraliomargarita parva TaxID=3014050 RepID=UPI0022B3C950|nr:type II toxin-antitoxin system Phd/YefM family antitoxin [Coraliomargarita parva]
MDSYALYDAKNRLSELCNKVVETGEPCVISRRGKAIVKLVPVDEEVTGSVWNTVEESQARYGPLDADFELPTRTASMNPSPLDEA